MLFVLVLNVAIYLLALNSPLSFFFPFFWGFNSSYYYPLRTVLFRLLFGYLVLHYLCSVKLKLN